MTDDEDRAAMAELDKIFDVPFVFWRCPRGCKGSVAWAERWGGMVATCEACGQQSPLIETKGA